MVRKYIDHVAEPNPGLAELRKRELHMSTNTQTATTAASAGTATAPANKLYSVLLGPRRSGRDNAPKEGEKTITMIISAPDYKNGWERAREVTRVGSANFQVGGKPALVHSDKEQKNVLTVAPGIWSVRSVTSLTEKRSKAQPIGLNDLVARAKAENIAIPAAVQKLIDAMSAPAEASAPAAN